MAKKKLSIKEMVDIVWKKLNVTDENCVVVFVGKVGSGKSLCAIRFCQLIDPNFCLERIVFSPEEFYALMEKDLPQGHAILFEEMGLSSDKRRWMTTTSLLLSHTFETMRHRNGLVAMTVPSLAYIDSRLVTMLDYLFETKATHRRKGKMTWAKLWVLVVDHNPKTEKTYKKRIVLKGETDGSRRCQIQSITLKAPQDEAFIKAYKKKKRAFTDANDMMIGEEMKAKKEKADGQEAGLSNEDIYQQCLKRADELKKKWQGKWCISQAVICNEFPVSVSRARSIANRLGKSLNTPIVHDRRSDRVKSSFPLVENDETTKTSSNTQEEVVTQDNVAEEESNGED